LSSFNGSKTRLLLSMARRTNAELLRDSKKYELVDMDEPDAFSIPVPNYSSSSKSKPGGKSDDKIKDRKSKHKHKKSRDSSSEDETVVKKKKYEAQRTQDLGAVNAVEATIDTDIAERDAFVARLLEKEEANTKKIDSAGLSASQIHELATKGTLTSKKQETSTIEQLREISRQHYLEKREEKELKLLEMSLRDEEDLFDGVKLSAAEQKRRDLNMEVLKMARDRHRFSYKDDSYHIPDGFEGEDGKIDKKKKESVLTARYVEEEQLKTEQEQWEEEQLKMSKVRFGAEERSGTNKQYDLVLDDQIEFISQEYLKGTRNEESGSESVSDDEKQESKSSRIILTAHEQILLGRKQLPVFQYRDEFLAAVQENKVLVVVGETGSGS
jgi:pre-mRNA-splicing factor ATP-dependent RNA helicase DHX16